MIILNPTFVLHHTIHKLRSNTLNVDWKIVRVQSYRIIDLRSAKNIEIQYQPRPLVPMIITSHIRVN